MKLVLSLVEGFVARTFVLIRESCPEPRPELVEGLVKGFVANSFTSRCVSMVLLGKVFDADGDIGHRLDLLTPQFCGLEWGTMWLLLSSQS